MGDAALTHERRSTRLSTAELLDLYWYMLLSRRLDERAWVLHRQGKIVFHISGIGHEACQVAAAFALNRGVDFVYPYYRDLALCLTLGITPADFMLSLFGKAGEVSSGGRQMPSHWSSKSLRIVTQSASVATQVPEAAGTAFAIQYRQKVGLVQRDDTTQARVVLTCLGEGSTSQGEWHEGMNWAGIYQLPFVCLVQNNHYAISVPFEKQSGVPNVADRAAGYGMNGVIVDGNDILACYDVMKTAYEQAYNGEGPTLVEAKTYRVVPHSSDDDDRSYRPREEVEEWKKKDPILRYQAHLVSEGVLTETLIAEYEARAAALVDEAHRTAEAAPYPPLDLMYGPVYAPSEED